jgi:DNA-directed RNA polymerase subunit RPC12/RpoP
MIRKYLLIINTRYISCVQGENPAMGNGLVCPYGKCGKEFKQPVLLSSEADMTRETYYACPHCRSKLDLVLTDAKNFNTVEAIATSDTKTHVCKEEKPESCMYFIGYLRTLPEDASLPERCLTCPKVVLCFVRH